VAVSSGTAALHLALLVAGVRPGDRVALPTLNFVAAAAAVRYCGASTVFDPRGTDRDIKAEIDVHLLGRVSGRVVMTDPKGFGIEDAAEALGSRWHNKPCGSFWNISVLSFNNNKIVTTGGGGAVLTNDEDVADRVRHLATTARLPGLDFDHDAVGFNYRMGNVNAALGLTQLLHLPTILRRKREIHEAYVHQIAAIIDADLSMPPEPSENERPNYWLNAITVPMTLRDFIMDALRSDGINCRPLFKPLHMLAPYSGFERDDEAADRATKHWLSTILLPSGAFN
jgi:perosamine synthetase